MNTALPRLLWGLALGFAAFSCVTEEESLGRRSGPVEGIDGGQPCLLPSPEGCRTTGCPAGKVCTTSNLPNECAPTSCSCDGRTGSWVCSADCGGGFCKYPSDAPPPRG